MGVGALDATLDKVWFSRDGMDHLKKLIASSMNGKNICDLFWYVF